MKRLIAVLGILLSAGASSAFADSVTLTFTGLQNLEPINNFYNGGTGGFGSTGGTNYGIAFSSDSLAVISAQSGGTGNFSNVPAPATNTIAFFLNGSGDTMDVAAGFTTGFSFYYDASQPGSVNVYSGLDGTGTLLQTIGLPVSATGCDSSGLYYDCWTQAGVAFNGTAESVVFGGAANFIGFADITLGSSTVPTATPEPSSLILLATGALGAAGAIRRRLMA